MMSRERHSTPRTLTRKEQKTSSAELMAAEEFQILPKKKEHQPSSLLPQPTRSNAHKYLIIMAITWKATTTTAVLAVGLLLLTPSIDGFSVIATKPRCTQTVAYMYGGANRFQEKYYQLEEIEENESVTTEVFLKADRTVAFGQTDGPRYSAADGKWDIHPVTNELTMVVRRRFDAGQPNTDVGEFDYHLERKFSGEMTNIGANVGIIDGVMSEHHDGSAVVGYFSLIDATGERNQRREMRIQSSCR